MERSPIRHNPNQIQIKPGVLRKLGTRTGISDIGIVESQFRTIFSQAKPVELKPKDLPPHLRPPKGGEISYRIDPQNPSIVYQVVTKGEIVSVEEVLDFGVRGTKTGRARY